MPRGGDQTRRLSLLLILATLGAAIILYRLSSSGSRTRPNPRNRPDRGIPIEEPPVDDDDDALGKRIWRRRVVAVGDLHGDLNNAQTVLRMAGLISSTPSASWVGKTDVLVQTGDIVDRGTDTIALYRMFQRLRGESTAVGGGVVSILGNHEIMNAIGDWRYVTKEDIETFGGSERRQEALSTDGWIGREWIANYSVVARVPLGPPNIDIESDAYLSFSHGSLHPHLPLLTPFPSNPNALAHSLLTKALTKPMPLPYPPNPYPGLPASATADEKTLYGPDGVVWWRGLATEEDEELVCEWVDVLQKRLGVRRIIGGHTPNFEEIVSRCRGGAIIIDTGISKAYGGVLSALEIVYELFEVELGIAAVAEVVIGEEETQQVEDEGEDKRTRSQQGFSATLEVTTKNTIGKNKKVREVETVTAIYPHGRVQIDRRTAIVEMS